MSIYENTPDSFWLKVHIRDFLDSLAKKGYTKGTINGYKNAASRICGHVEILGVGPEDLDAELFGKLATACPCTGSSSMETILSLTARRITDDLIDRGVISKPPEEVSVGGTRNHLLLELDNWLKTIRGLSKSTVIVNRNVFKRFLDHFAQTAASGVDDLASLTPGMIHDFLFEHAGKNGWRIRYLRNILRFLFWSGRTSGDLSLAIPPVVSCRRKNTARHADPATVGKLLAVIRGDTPLALRDYAALLLMARLGLRVREVVAMQLDDIDWSVGRVLIRGKGGDQSHMPLPIDVGEALVTWLRHGRRGSSRHVFVTVMAPFRPLATTQSFRTAIRKAYIRSGMIPPDGEFRTHSLRHGLAMTLLDKGHSLAEISDVLRHQNIQTTTVYARYDIKALRPLACTWPLEGGVQ